MTASSFNFFFVFYFLSLNRTKTDVRGCCSDYNWDPTKACSPGYTGVGGSLACVYPLFGEKCQQVCECSETECSPVNGCTYSYLSTPRNENQIIWFGKEDISTTQVTTHTNVKYREDMAVGTGHWVQTLWQVMISILGLGVLAIFTIKYFGKIVCRRWKSRTSDARGKAGEVERRFRYEIAEAVTDDSYSAPYDEIHESGILQNQTLSIDKTYENVMADTLPSLPSNYSFNEVSDKVQRDKEVDDAYITPYM